MGEETSKIGDYSLIKKYGLKNYHNHHYFALILFLLSNKNYMCSEHQKYIFLQAELNTCKLLSYSWLCKYPARHKQINTGI